ncbi:hypothetical protein [Ensifer sp. B1-9]|uniref:hypothetical protein n=1 Tax=Ensifer sp. B1-9 TaxID=3141455 RepID=UPI003D1E6D5E
MSQDKSAQARQIAERVVDEALSSELIICVSNGGQEPKLHGSTDKAKIMNALFETDLSVLTISMPDGEEYGDVFIRESLGHQAIVDYRGRHYGAIEDIVAPAVELAKQLGAAEAEQVATKSLYQMIDAGEERPAHVSVEDWKAATRDYSHQMTLENTPQWYINGGSPEDERFYEAMESGVSYESREEIVAALRELKAKGEHPEVIQGWNTYTLQGDEVFQENHESHPDRGGEWERWDANNPERTIDSHWLADQRNEERDNAEWDVAVEVASYEQLHGAELIATLREKGGPIEHNGSSYSLAENMDYFIKTELDGTSQQFSCRSVAFDAAGIREDQAAAQSASAPVSDAQLDEVFEQFADDHMRSVHGIGTGDERPTLTAEQTKAILANKEMDDFQKTLQLVEEIENGFPNQDPLFSELHADMEIQRRIFGAPWSPSSSTSVKVSEIAKQPDQSNVVSIKEMAASFRTVGQAETSEKPKAAGQATDVFAGMSGMSDTQRQILGTDAAPSIPAAQGKPAVAAQSTEQPSAPSFMKARRPDFSTTPPKAAAQATTAPKLTSESRIVRLEDRDAKPKLASDELMKQGAGVSVERKAFTLSGKEIVASYEMTKGGNVVYTDYDGSKTEMSFERAKRHEIAHLAQLNANALIAINMMATDPKFTLRQGDATYSVQNGFFCQRLDNGSFKKEPLARTQQRWMERGREIEAMMPAKSRVTSELAASFRSVTPPQGGNSKTKSVEQGMTQ